MDCRICGRPGLEAFFKMENYPLSNTVAVTGAASVPVGPVGLGMCMGCGLLQLTDPDPASIQYGDEYRSSNIRVPGMPEDEKRQRFLRALQDTGLPPGTKVLEIGCYDGSLMNTMRDGMDWEVWGCDPSGPAQELAKTDPRVRAEMFNPERYGPRSCDLVVFRNVLEHVPDPLAFLTGVRRVLRATGQVVLEVPDGEFRVANAIMGSVVPQHATYFGYDSLRDVLHRAGFGAVRLLTYQGGLIATARRQGVAPRGKALSPSQKYWCMIGGVRALRLKHRNVTQYVNRMDGDVWLYGANTCSLELLAEGAILTRRLAGVIDDDSLKQNRTLVNTDARIFPRTAVFTQPIRNIVVCSYYSHTALVQFLVDALLPPWRILRLHSTVRTVTKEA